MTISVLKVNAIAFKGVRRWRSVSLHDGPRLSVRHVRGHHRILVIRLVDSTCTDLGDGRGITSGVWGGTSEDERRAVRRPAGKK
jgi:hypothetical protein